MEKEKEKDFTYTATGEYVNANKLELNICLPPEDSIINSGLHYQFGPFFNISKIVSGSHINAVVIILNTTGEDGSLNGGTNVVNQTINITGFEPYTRTPETYLSNSNVTLVCILHDNTHQKNDIEKLYDKLKDIYDEADKERYNIFLDDLYDSKDGEPLDLPRKIGMSIIPKGIRP